MDKLTFILLLGACLVGFMALVTLLIVGITHIPITPPIDTEE